MYSAILTQPCLALDMTHPLHLDSQPHFFAALGPASQTQPCSSRLGTVPQHIAQLSHISMATKLNCDPYAFQAHGNPFFFFKVWLQLGSMLWNGPCLSSNIVSKVVKTVASLWTAWVLV